MSGHPVLFGWKMSDVRLLFQALKVDYIELTILILVHTYITNCLEIPLHKESEYNIFTGLC